MKVLIIVILVGFAFIHAAEKCPNGGEIFEWGISEQGKKDIVTEHNKYRQQLLDGIVPKQPKGKNIKMVKFDQNLATQGRKVSSTCQMNHVIASDSRWGWVGQNLYMSWSSAKSSTQDWSKAAASWFNEYKDFTYPNKSSGVTGHYTQLIWSDSDSVGCDYISYYDAGKPQYPYAKLYTCNYGPGGNIGGAAPYQLA